MDTFELAQIILEQWILSDEALEGSLWEDLCQQLGYDSTSLAISAAKARQVHPRLRCGHYDVPENIYIRFERKQCRQCAAKRPEEEIKVVTDDNNSGE